MTVISLSHNTVMQGHVLDKLKEIPNDTIDVIFTSTPYYGLRDYGPECISIWGGLANCEHNFQLKEVIEESHLNKGFNERWGNAAGDKKQETATGIHSVRGFCLKCGAWKGQLGLEPTPQMFIEHLSQVFLEIKRVLKPSGSLWLNLGDTYFGGKGKSGNASPERTALRSTMGETLQHSYDDYSTDKPHNLCKQDGKWLQPKQKMLIPERVAIALQDQGWILRNAIIWHKLNHMPESVTDRLTRSHETIYFFAKSGSYYFNLDAIREQSHTVPWTVKPSPKTVKGNDPRKNYAGKFNELNAETMGSPRARVVTRETVNFYNPKGKNPGDVWSLTNEGISEEHFAAFPQKLVRRVLECAAPKGGLVLDPFAGSGTTLLVAHKMGLDWLGIELVPKYCAIIEKRIAKHGKIRLDTWTQEAVIG